MPGESMVRPATAADLSRIAEILVFGKRTAYRDIFRDDAGSFGELQVWNVIREYQSDPRKLARALVYDDGVVKGVLTRSGPADDPDTAALEELYVEPVFIGTGVGRALMLAFLAEAGAREKSFARLWVIQENGAARRFYERFGFAPDGREQNVPGTSVLEMGYTKAL